MYLEGSVQSGATAYEAILKRHGPMDLVLLGIGDDGHTASLFPGIPELEVRDRLVVPTTSPKGVPQRLSMTRTALAESRLLLFLVSGADKQAAFSMAIGDDDSVRPPSGMVAKEAHAVLWFVDQAAGA
jgi:6-phosphogluconolactonase